MKPTVRTRVRHWCNRLQRHWEVYRAPWPVIGECFQSHKPDHSCPQCDDSHQHAWVTWPKAPRWIAGGPGVPVRCRVCGGRKCDFGGCNGQRHFHRHGDAA